MMRHALRVARDVEKPFSPRITHDGLRIMNCASRRLRTPQMANQIACISV